MEYENNKRAPGARIYDNRVMELEAELEAAKRLIADQHQILKSNLSAGAVRAERESAPSAVEHPLPPLKPVRSESVQDHPPVKLPDFGPPVGDIAQRVFQAAADRDATPPPPPSTASAGAPASGIYADAHSMPGFTPLKKRSPLSRSLLVSGTLLLGGVLAAGLWSSFASKDSARDVSMPRRTVAPVSQSTPVDPVSTAPAPVSAPARESVKRSAGPVLEPVTSTPETPKVVHARPRRKAVVKRTHEDLRVARTTVVAAALPAQAESKPDLPAAPVRRPKWHRHRVTNASTHNVSSHEDWFDREAAHHPEPGWDEREDRWLDDFR